MPSPSIPSSMPVPIGPAAEYRISDVPRRAKTATVETSAIAASSESTRRNPSNELVRRSRAALK